MEWINPKYPIMNNAELLEENGVQTSLDETGPSTSLYDLELLPKVTHKEHYVLTSDGRLYNGAVKCKETKQKDRISKRSIKVVVHEDAKVFQFMLTFPDGTWVDARGQYARESLKIISKRKV